MAEAIRYIREGDTLTVWKLDRLGRSRKHLVQIITEMEAKGVGFRTVTENIDTTTSDDRLVSHLFGALAQLGLDNVPFKIGKVKATARHSRLQNQCRP